MTRTLRVPGNVFAVVLAMGLVGLFNWRVDEGGIDMGVLLLASGAVGLIVPRRAWLAGLLVGLVIPVQGVFTAMTGLHPVFERGTALTRHGPDFGLLVLVLPALLAALSGAWIRQVALRGSQ